jgi:hypothetical protein
VLCDDGSGEDAADLRSFWYCNDEWLLGNDAAVSA